MNDPTAAIVAVRVAFGFGFTPCGSPNPPTFGVGADMLFATVVGVSLLNIPTFGCGGGVNRFGGAASIFGMIGVGSLISATFGGGGSGFGISIFGCSSFTTGGGGMIFTFGTGGTYGFGCSTGKISCVVWYLCSCTWCTCAMVSSSINAAIVTLMTMLIPNEPMRPSGSGSSPNVPRFSDCLSPLPCFSNIACKKKLRLLVQCIRLLCTLMTSDAL